VNADSRCQAVAAAVDAIDTRTSAQGDFVMAALVRSAWPGGIADRLERSAVEWVRRWGPNGTPPDYLGDCSCAHGSCLVCN
jgi:hypothetical protein